MSRAVLWKANLELTSPPGFCCPCFWTKAADGALREKRVFRLDSLSLFFFSSCIWAGHNLYHSGLLKLVQEDFILQACLTGILLARRVQLCIQLRFIFYVCVKAPAMNLAAHSFTFILHSSAQSPAHFHRPSLRIALGGAERTEAKNRRSNSERGTRKQDFSNFSHHTFQINEMYT